MTAEEQLELERERDRDERDALVERMLDKDKSKTKQMELGGLTPAQVSGRRRSRSKLVGQTDRQEEEGRDGHQEG